ncbi:hypothetical protein [Subtercola lobariae]|uniref:Uncharacterized protein n=1 Tax=Subtercola lobariae TaxID=1588641 RepID=A0A917AZP4_9MICO|nr:hypothetical protein [Subtercola lobariae]GGF12205.1 hypothetical protein GCM10011399_02670 [Subtercola lobariae]
MPAALVARVAGTTIVPIEGPPIEWNLSFVRRSTTLPGPAVTAFLALVERRRVSGI